MNDVKDICAVMLDQPEPPLPPATQVWSTAREATRRRTTHRAVGATAASLAAVVVAALLATGLPAGSPVTVGPEAATSADGDPPARPAPDMVAAAQTTLPDVPTPEEIQANGGKMSALLRGTVPAGFRAEPRWGDVPSLWYINDTATADPLHPGLDLARLPYAAVASVSIRAGGREGDLTAHVIGDNRPAPTGDLCDAQVGARVHEVRGSGYTCQVLTIGGLPIRVTTRHDDEQQLVIQATWFVRNGWVTVSAAQGMWRFEADGQRPPDAPNSGGALPTYLPPLTQPVFTPQQVAEIAADPNLLP